MKIKVSEASGPVLDWLVTKALGGCALVGVAPVRAYLMSLNEDDLWNTLCVYTPGGMDASIMDRLEMIDYGVRNWQQPAYSTDWGHGGPIIEREGIAVLPPTVRRIAKERHAFPIDYWRAMIQTDENELAIHGKGPTPLIAAMRCYVASKLGEEVETPDGLV